MVLERDAHDGVELVVAAEPEAGQVGHGEREVAGSRRQELDAVAAVRSRHLVDVRVPRRAERHLDDERHRRADALRRHVRPRHADQVALGEDRQVGQARDRAELGAGGDEAGAERRVEDPGEVAAGRQERLGRAGVVGVVGDERWPFVVGDLRAGGECSDPQRDGHQERAERAEPPQCPHNPLL